MTIVRENAGLFVWNPSLASFMDPPSINRLSEIKAPVLVITADRDLEDNKAASDLLVDRIAGASKAFITGGGHLICMEQPEKFNRIVGDFLASVDK